MTTPRFSLAVLAMILALGTGAPMPDPLKLSDYQLKTKTLNWVDSQECLDTLNKCDLKEVPVNSITSCKEFNDKCVNKDVAASAVPGAPSAVPAADSKVSAVPGAAKPSVLPAVKVLVSGNQTDGKSSAASCTIFGSIGITLAFALLF
uniref:Secreted protein n=1 Tax=Panagrellus redivivus TaxID=6233 RepID=A0A7E4VFS1_PANRE